MPSLSGCRLLIYLLKSSLDLSQHCFRFVLPSFGRGKWDRSSLTRVRTHTPCLGRRSLNPWAVPEGPFICNPTEASPGRPPPKTQHGSPYNPKVSAVSPSFDFPLCPLASCKLVFKEVVFVLQVRVGVNVASVAPCEEQGAPTGQGVSLICKPGGGGGICPRSACPPGPLQPISSCSRLWGQQPGHRGRRCPPGDQDGRARGPRPSTCAGGQGTERLAQHSPGPRLNGRRLSPKTNMLLP